MRCLGNEWRFSEPMRDTNPMSKKLHIVNDDVPSISIKILKKACDDRGIKTLVHESPSFVYEPFRKAEPGDLLFRPAISSLAMKVEQYLFQPGVSTFYREPWGIFYSSNNATCLFEHHNVPIPRTFYIHNTSREVIDFYVEQLGGFPVVLKVLGYSGGVGVMKLDNPESLYSVVDFVCASGSIPVLSAFIPDAVHWRCVVVGEKVIAAYINPPDGKDFRTYGTTNKDEVFDSVSSDMEAIAVQAVHALGNDFGGVDILKHPSGRSYVLEANFPCYYAHAQSIGGIDVAGKMIDYLLNKNAPSYQ